ncbi:hypothetical protein D3C72_1845630 [compost metagenome]
MLQGLVQLRLHLLLNLLALFPHILAGIDLRHLDTLHRRRGTRTVGTPGGLQILLHQDGNNGHDHQDTDETKNSAHTSPPTTGCDGAIIARQGLRTCSKSLRSRVGAQSGCVRSDVARCSAQKSPDFAPTRRDSNLAGARLGAIYVVADPRNSNAIAAVLRR